MSENAEIVIPIKMTANNESNKATAETFESLTSMISDLAIIGTVAGNALGKVWGAFSSTLADGSKSFKESAEALVNEFSTIDYKKLQTALGAAGGSRDDAMGITDQINNLSKGMTDPFFAEGKFRTQLEEAIAKAIMAGAPEALGTALHSALGEKRNMDAAQLIGQMIDASGTEGKEVANMFGVGGMAVLENDQSYMYFRSIMGESNVMYDRNLGLLGQLNKSLELLTTASDSLKTSVATLNAPGSTYFSLLTAGIAEMFKKETDATTETEGFKKLNEVMTQAGWVDRWKYGQEPNDFVTGDDVTLSNLMRYYTNNIEDFGGKMSIFPGIPSKTPENHAQYMEAMGLSGYNFNTVDDLVSQNYPSGTNIMGGQGSMVPRTEATEITIYAQGMTPETFLEEVKQKIYEETYNEGWWANP